jgi:GT2 family glycosyltransferase
MKFSVIIPTCHRNTDLAACLKLLAPGAQMLAAAEYEVIVTDDGRHSTAEGMVREQFSWARWVPGPRRGPAANRNHGARHATSEWLVFTDDDCLPETGWLAAYAAVATAGPTVLEGRTVGCGERRRLDMECPVNETGGCLWSCNFAVRRKTFLDLGGFDEGFPGAAMEDMDLHERLKLAGHHARFVPEALVHHPWRIRRGRAFVRLHTESVARYVAKHPQTRVNFGLSLQLRGLVRRTLRGVVQALREFGGRGVMRQILLDLYWQWCLRRALAAVSNENHAKR